MHSRRELSDEDRKSMKDALATYVAVDDNAIAANEKQGLANRIQTVLDIQYRCGNKQTSVFFCTAAKKDD